MLPSPMPAVDGDKIYIDYDPLAKGTGHVPPRVTIEYGARSTGELSAAARCLTAKTKPS
jgi:hypothetical protein